MKRLWALLALLILMAGLIGPVSAQKPTETTQQDNGTTSTGVAPAGQPAEPEAPEALWPGPDGYGYNGSAVTFSWVDIRGTGTPITGWSNADDGYAGPFNIGFTFSFYGANYTQFMAETNGFLDLGTTGSGSLGNQCPLPNATTPNNIIAMLWDDLNFNTSGNAYYQTFANCPVGPTGQCLVVEYYNTAHYGGAAGSAGTWEAILYGSGEIRIQFQDSGTEMGSGSTTGIEGNNAPANHGLTYACETANSVPDGLAIRFSVQPFIRVTPPAQFADSCICQEYEHVLTAINGSGVADTFQMTYSMAGPGQVFGPASVGPIPNGGSLPFTVMVKLDGCLMPSTTITATVLATAPTTGLTSTATIAKHAVAGATFWQRIADEPSTGRMDNVVAGYGGFVWDVTGYGNSTTVRRYDPASNTWTILTPGGAVPPINYARSGCTHGNTVYTYGDASGAFTGLRSYNMDTNTWTALTPGGTPPAQAGIWAPAWVHDPETGFCYMTGGASAPGAGNLTTVYVYDPTGNAWLTQLPNFQSVRDFHAAFIFNRVSDGHKLLCVAGGNNGVGLASTQCYDFVAGAWNAENADMGAMPETLWGMGYAQKVHLGSEPQMWVMDGVNASGAAIATTRYYDVNTNTWVGGGNTPSGAVYRTSATTLNNEVYKIAGSTGGFTYSGLSDHHVQLVCPPCTSLDGIKLAPPQAGIGEVVTYTVVISPGAIQPDMVMADPLPPGALFAGGLTWTMGIAWYSPTVNTVFWTMPRPPTAVGHPVQPAQPAGPLPADALDIASASEAPGPAPSGQPAPLYAWPEAVLWDNGPLVTDPGVCGGQDASRLQTGLGMNTLGFGHQFPLGYRMSDQFEITDPLGWDIGQITFFAYQSGAPSNPSPITGVYYQIWDGPPWAGGTIIWGDLVTNRLQSSTFTNIQRDSGTAPCANNRYIFADVANAGVHLNPGTYWLDWTTEGNPSYSGPWAPPITIVGQTTTGDAYQYTTAWNPALDTGTSTQQGMPFVIEGEVTPPPVVRVSFNVTMTGACHDVVINEARLTCALDSVVFPAATEIVGVPDIEVFAPPLWAELCPTSTEVITFTICNAGDCDLLWQLHEMTPALKLAGSMPFVPVEVGGRGVNPGLTTASPKVQPEAVPVANPEDVLWDQPLSVVNQAAYVDQEFPDAPDYSSFLADDFVNPVGWDLMSIFIPGDGWGGFTTLMNATALTWQIYADCAGVPCGDPSGGGNPPVWGLTLPPTDPQVVLTNGTPGGMPSNVQLNLAAPVGLPAGTWWLVFYPTMSFGSYGQYGRQAADTTNGYTAQFINPGGGFGFGTVWQPWSIIGPTQTDIAFRIEGQPSIVYPDYPWVSESPLTGTLPPGGCTQVDVTFDSTGLPPGDYFADLLIVSNDPDEPVVTLPMTMTVDAPALADFSSNTPICLGQDALFTNGSSGSPPPTYLWTFGDGGTSTETNPIHVYTATGTYDVSLLAENACGSSTAVQAFVVNPLAVASFDYNPASGVVPLTVYFTDTSTAAISPTWTFGDGGSGSGANVQHTYTAVGDYTVTLTVESPYGCGMSTATHVVHVTPPCEPPSGVEFTWMPTSPRVGEATRFTGTVAAGTTPFFYTWAFGDGSGATGSANVSYTYATAGNFTVTLTVTNTCGLASMAHPITVLPGAFYVYLPIIFKGATP